MLVKLIISVLTSAGFPHVAAVGRAGRMGNGTLAKRDVLTAGQDCS